MKLVQLNCPCCGANLKLDSHTAKTCCLYCKSELVLDSVECLPTNNSESAASSTAYQPEIAAKGASSCLLTFLWGMSWLIFFPIPLTILIARSKKINRQLKTGLFLILWGLIFYAVMLYYPQIQKSSFNGNAATHTADKSAKSLSESTPLPGRGHTTGGQEPQYIGSAGYLAITSTQGFAINDDENFMNPALWVIPTYLPDKQFWNKTDITLAHKTPVIVRKQILKKRDAQKYTGYLLVESTQTHEQHYIEADNFVTTAYWENKDLRTAAAVGCLIAEYHQKSDYYPVTNDKQKVSLKDGTLVLVSGLSSSHIDFSEKSPGIKASVWAEWENGYGSIQVHFAAEDLRVVY